MKNDFAFYINKFLVTIILTENKRTISTIKILEKSSYINSLTVQVVRIHFFLQILRQNLSIGKTLTGSTL